MHSSFKINRVIVVVSGQELGGERLDGECLDFQASPGHGLQCTVTGVERGEEEGGRKGGRVTRQLCQDTDLTLGKLTREDGSGQSYRVSLQTSVSGGSPDVSLKINFPLQKLLKNFHNTMIK